MKRVIKNIFGVAAALLVAAVVFGHGARSAGGASGAQGVQSAQNAPDASGVQAQDVPVVRASLTPDSIGIGDRVILRVKVEKDARQVVSFPTLDRLQGGGMIEVLGEEPADTLSRTGRRVTLEKRYTLTSFDAGIYSMGRIAVVYADKNVVDTLRSADTLVLKVTTFQIDTTKQQIFDIKPPIPAPLRFGEIRGYLLWGLLALALLAGIIWVIYRYSRKLPLVGPARERTLEPAHIVALRALEKLYNQKTLMADRHKAYYTALTEIVREYIARRYAIAAPEMTTGEIVAALRAEDVPQRSVEALEGTLRVADLVKFAKFAPSLDENEQSYFAAYHFVEDTKQVAEEKSPQEKTSQEKATQDKPSQKEAK